MSVFKRKTSAGYTKEFHYKFVQGGKSFFGVCEGCEDKDAAIEYEKRQRQVVKELSSQRNVKALVENFRDELAGGEKILLAKAFDLSIKKPRRHSASDVHISKKRARFDDFVSYMQKSYHDIKYLSQVRKSHAESYIHHIRTEGRFDKTVVFKNHLKKDGNQSKYERKERKLSPSTINSYQKSISEVFNILADDAGIFENPFAKIPLLQEEGESREAFTETELASICANWDEFNRKIFMTGFFTALREGDIATLKKDNVDFENLIIHRKMLKTGKLVEIPIMPPLEAFLREQIALSGECEEYVFPDLARMYISNPSGISYRVKSFLESLGIRTSRKVPGRDRAISVKDVHSLRHTFCYFAGVAGIPLVVVQSIVGHMTPEMTSRYTAHADRKTKREKLSALTSFGAMVAETRRTALVEQTRRAIIDKVMEADDDTLNRIASILLPPKPKKSLLHSTALDKSRK